jgi:hypothetical protein
VFVVVKKSKLRVSHNEIQRRLRLCATSKNVNELACHPDALRQAQGKLRGVFAVNRCDTQVMQSFLLVPRRSGKCDI